MQLEDHLIDRMQTPVYAVLKSNLLTFFKTILSLDEFDETTILKAAAILDINAFELRSNERQSKIRAIYLDASMLSHDCVPNAYHVFDENMEISVIAAGLYAKYQFHSFEYQNIDRRFVSSLHFS